MAARSSDGSFCPRSHPTSPNASPTPRAPQVNPVHTMVTASGSVYSESTQAGLGAEGEPQQAPWPLCGQCPGPELNLISTKESARPLWRAPWEFGLMGPQNEKDRMAGKLWGPRDFSPALRNNPGPCARVHRAAQGQRPTPETALLTQVAATSISLADRGCQEAVGPWAGLSPSAGSLPRPRKSRVEGKPFLVLSKKPPAPSSPPGVVVEQPGSGDGSPTRHPEQRVREPWSVRW